MLHVLALPLALSLTVARSARLEFAEHPTPSDPPAVSPGGRGLGTDSGSGGRGLGTGSGSGGRGLGTGSGGPAGVASQPHPRAVGDPTALPAEGSATIRICFDGLPRGAFRESIDVDADFLRVRATGEEGAAHGLVLSFDQLEAGVELSVPEGPSRLSLAVGEAPLEERSAAVELADGQVLDLEVDLRGDEAVKLSIDGLPDPAVGPVRLERFVLKGALRGAGGSSINVPIHWSFPVDPSGESLWIPDPLIPVSARITNEAGEITRFQLIRDHVDLSAEVPVWTCRPAWPIVELRAPEGSAIQVGVGHVAAPTPYISASTDPRVSHHLSLVEGRTWTVFVDGRRAGSVTSEALRRGGRSSYPLDDVLVPCPPPNLVVTIRGDCPPETRLRLYRVDGGEIDVWDAEPDPFGEVRFADQIAQDRRTLALWQSLGCEGVRAEATVPAGTYALVLDSGDPRLADHVRLEPITLEEGSIEPLDITLDLDRARHWTIGYEFEDGRQHTILPHCLMVGGAVVHVGYLDRAPLDAPRGRPQVARDHARVWTFGGIPERATLYHVSGASGRVVPLRPATPRELERGLDLVATLPVVRSVEAPFEPLHGQRVVGRSSHVPFELDFSLLAALSGVYRQPPSVELRRPDRIRVRLADESASGSISEIGPGTRSFLRDWWKASNDELTLLSEGEGRFIEVTSSHHRRALLYATPPGDFEELEPARVGALEPGATERFWIPTAAERLLCFEDDEAARLRGAEPLEDGVPPIAMFELDGHEHFWIAP